MSKLRNMNGFQNIIHSFWHWQKVNILLQLTIVSWNYRCSLPAFVYGANNLWEHLPFTLTNEGKKNSREKNVFIKFSVSLYLSYSFAFVLAHCFFLKFLVKFIFAIFFSYIDKCQHLFSVLRIAYALDACSSFFLLIGISIIMMKLF